MSARSTNVLATWMLEHPLELGALSGGALSGGALSGGALEEGGGLLEAITPFNLLPGSIGVDATASDRWVG